MVKTTYVNAIFRVKVNYKQKVGFTFCSHDRYVIGVCISIHIVLKLTRGCYPFFLDLWSHDYSQSEFSTVHLGWKQRHIEKYVQT